MALGFHLDDIEEAYFSDPQKMYELNQQIRNLKKQLKTARVEAIKEFAERLKKEIDERWYYDLAGIDDTMCALKVIAMWARELEVLALLESELEERERKEK